MYTVGQEEEALPSGLLAWSALASESVTALFPFIAVLILTALAPSSLLDLLGDLTLGDAAYRSGRLGALRSPPAASCAVSAVSPLRGCCGAGAEELPPLPI